MGRYSTIALLAIVGLIFHSSQAALSQKSSSPLASRDFPVVHFQIGDVPVALPEAWIEKQFARLLPGRSRTVFFPNADTWLPSIRPGLPK